jgi:iron(III) transport system substrate-binding protein
VGVIFPNQANRGTHVNISGGAVARYAPNKAVAVKFLEYLVSPQAQKYFAEGNSEFPVVAGVELSAELKSLGTFKEDQLNARVFAQNNAEALKIMDRAGGSRPPAVLPIARPTRSPGRARPPRSRSNRPRLAQAARRTQR